MDLANESTYIIIRLFFCWREIAEIGFDDDNDGPTVNFLTAEYICSVWYINGILYSMYHFLDILYHFF